MFSASNPRVLLYVKPGTPQCQRPIQIAQQFPEIAVLDISRLRMRPAWIRGTPALFLVENRMHFHGNDVLQVLEKYAKQFGSAVNPERGPYSESRQPRNADSHMPMQPRSSTMRPMQGRMSAPEPPSVSGQAAAPLSTAMSPFHSGPETTQELQPMSSGMSNFETVPHHDDDSSSYTADGTITEASIQDYMRKRTEQYKYN